MKKLILCLLAVIAVCCIFAGCGSVTALEAVSKNLTTYTISAVVDCQNKTVTATENVKYINKSTMELTELKFHLYPNAFREEASVFKAVNATQMSRAYPNGFSNGQIDIICVTSNGKNLDYLITGEDKNILAVSLENTLRPNCVVQIEINFSLILPNCNHRFGYGDETINLGNWYPIVCVFEDGNFVCDGYSPNGDPFYSDIANYLVTITYNNNYRLASSGNIIDTTTLNNQTTTTLCASAVRDFAFVLSDKFEVVSTQVDDIAVNYYYFDDSKYNEHLNTAVDALNTFNQMIGKYPYKVLNVAKANFCQGGMEYPNLVYISNQVEVDSEYNNVIVHEIAHQWWYGVVGDNECENAWIDEGLAEYSTALFYDQNPKYNKTTRDVLGTALSSYLLFCDVYSEVYQNFDSSMNRNIHNFKTETEYVYLTYVKSVLMFDSISDIVGNKKMMAFLKDFYSTNAFKIAKPADLIKSFERVTHKKLAGYIMSWLDGSVVFEELKG